jgi:hypothetical protein
MKTSTKYFILFIFIAVGCKKQNCDCGTITDTGTTSLGNVKVELTTDCKTDWYVIYDTSRTWTKGDPGCIDDFGHKLNLYIHKLDTAAAFKDWKNASDSGYTDGSFEQWMNNDSGNQVYELNK